MTSLLEIPNYELAAKSLHSTSHEVVDSTPGFICTETTSNTSFTENSILRVKEIRCDRNGGKIRTTGIIISNTNQVQAGQVVPDSAVYDNVGGFTTAQIVTFGNTSNNSALVVKSGGAYIGDGAIVAGTVTANQLNVSGTSSFAGLMTFNGGLSGNIQYGTITATTRINAPEIDNGKDSNVNYRRNGTTIFTLEKTAENIETFKISGFLKRSGCPRFMATKATTAVSSTFTASGYIVSFPTVLVNQGNNFDSATGTFVAPIEGCYRFFFTGMQSSSSSVLILYRNGSSTLLSTTSSATGTHSFALDCFLNLAQNDSIRIFSNTQITLNTRFLFGGMLISSI